MDSQTNKNENTNKIPKKIGILREETVLGSIKIVKNDLTSPSKECSSDTKQSPSNWSATRIQRNVKLMPKRLDKIKNCHTNHTVAELAPQKGHEKRKI